MYTKILIPLDGSKTAEQVLPYARFFISQFKKPVELIAIIDIADMVTHVSAKSAPYLDTMIENGVRGSEAYLNEISATFHGANIQCAVEKGRAAEIIIERGEAETGMLIAMATYGRSGVDRWLLGSVAEKVLRGTVNPLLLIRATERFKPEGEAILKSIIVPLDGSELAESVLPMVAGIAKKLNLAITLFRSYSVPYSLYSYGHGFYAFDIQQFMTDLRDEARHYLENKAAEITELGVDKVSCVTIEGFGAGEIIKIGRETPNSFIAMCSHGRSGVKRWALGSVTESVVRHSDKPVLVLRPASMPPGTKREEELI